MRVTTNISREEPLNVYYNINMYNSGSVPVAAAYSETRISPIIMNPSQYYLSVMRFSIPGSEIPIFQVQTNPYPNTDVNQTVYSVTLTRNGTNSGQVFIIWNNPDPNDKPIVPLFTPQAPNQAPVDPYYYCYSYQLFLDCINTALATAYASLPDKGTTTLPPYITYDATTKLFSMWAEQSYFQNTNPNDPSNVLIWFNDRLQAFFPSFQYVFAGYNQPQGRDIAVIIKDNKNNSVTINGINYYQMLQEFSTVFSWPDIQSISFRSSTIPVNQEAVTGVVSGGTNNGQQSLQGNVSGYQLPFVTDFLPENNANNPFFRDVINYFPTSEYRLTDLNGTTPLTTVDMTIWWTDIYGNIHPVYISPGGNPVTIKLLFRRKAFYEGR